jgi:hypothetical protein
MVLEEKYMKDFDYNPLNFIGKQGALGLFLYLFILIPANFI